MILIIFVVMLAAIGFYWVCKTRSNIANNRKRSSDFLDDLFDDFID